MSRDCFECVFLLSGLQKLEQRAKKFNELLGEYVEYIPSGCQLRPDKCELQSLLRI